MVMKMAKKYDSVMNPPYLDHKNPDNLKKLEIEPMLGDFECTYRYMINMLLVAIKEKTLTSKKPRDFVLMAANSVREGEWEETDANYNLISEIYEKYICEKDGY